MNSRRKSLAPHAADNEASSPGSMADGGAGVVAFLVTVSAEGEDLAIALLWERGTQGIEVRAPAAGGRLLLAYFRPEGGLLHDLRRALARLDARVEAVAVPEVDWVARFREGFRPFRVGSFLIAPPWEAPSTPAAGERRLLLDPGRAFGTGTHESTRLCLLALEELAASGPLGRTVDVGTGTGILAVAAALLGARPVIAVDIDADAVEAARRHARLNGVGLQLARGDGGQPFAAGAFGLVLANLTSPLLVQRRRELAGLRAPGGALVLAGLLAEELDGVREAYSPFGRVEARAEGEWAALLVRS